MPRRRYYRRYTRVVTPKKKWASNIVQDGITTSTSSTIVQNSAQASLPTPVIVKCGNFRVQGDIAVTYTSGSSRIIPLNFFLLYVPEGVTPSDGLIGQHPEWIMAWTAIESPIALNASNNTVGGNKFSVTSRLKRNLNSGDRVVAILQSRDASVTAQAVFTCQYWTCAN